MTSLLGNALPWLLAVLTLMTSAARGGELSGAPPLTLPSAQARLEFLLSNDLFGRGGQVDDYRTQQLLVSSALAERWRITLDHSILTLEEQAQLPQGRLDQLSGSLSYDLVTADSASWLSKLSVGGGFRSYGEFGGARIQNGVHRIFDSSIVDAPYVGTQRTDLIAWVRAERSGSLPAIELPGGFGAAWETGYWLHGTTLVTSDAQWDGTAGAVVFAKKNWFEIWLGLRADWRSGYHRDPVQRFTAANEQGGYLTIGLRVGPLLLESNQGFDEDAAFGRVSLISRFGQRAVADRDGSRIGLALAASIPDVYADLQLRAAGVCAWLACDDYRRWAVVAGYRFGEPPDGNSAVRFVQTSQLSGALELEWRNPSWPDWVRAYGSGGLGWRRQRLVGDGALAGQFSRRVDRGVAIGEVGLRFAAVRTERWSMRITLGLTAWLPFSSDLVEFDGEMRRLQTPGAAIVLGAMGGFSI